MERNINKGFTEELKQEWQRYWLSCCLSEKCDYYFAELASLKKPRINREYEIKELWDNGILWGRISKEGRRFYLNTCIKLLLRRYALKEAWELWRTQGSPLSMLPNLLPLRLLGATSIGFLPLFTATEMWELPAIKLYSWARLFAIITPILILTWFYFLYECYNATGYSHKIIKRGTIVFLISVIASQLLSLIICSLFSMMIPDGGFLKTWVFFAAAALLIGIFIQVFWEEKTITEPL